MWSEPSVPWTRNLHWLRDAEGREITPEAHETCPGRAVAIAYDWEWAPGAEAAYRQANELGDEDEIGAREPSATSSAAS